MMIDKEIIGAVIGPGGKIIQELQKETDTVIAIEELEEEGRVEIAGVDQEKINLAIERIKQIAFVPEIGATYDATVKSIKPYGAFVEISKGVEGMVHISEIDNRRMHKDDDVLVIGAETRMR